MAGFKIYNSLKFDKLLFNFKELIIRNLIYEAINWL